MDVKARVNNNNTINTNTIQDDDMDLRRGPWTVEEDLALINYIATHGEGRWNSLARSAGLKRTGKSCRLRWLNYLRPDVRRGNITLEEQLLILELHARWGNRWSKIAQYLPGRTDNEIKNYWRTRVQKHAKQLKCDVNSKQFKDTMRYLWMPRLVERIQAAAAATTTTTTATNSTTTYNLNNNNNNNNNNFEVHSGNTMLGSTQTIIHSNNFGTSNSNVTQSNYATPENSSTGTVGSSDSFGTHDNYYSTPSTVGNNNDNPNYPNQDYYQQDNHQLSFNLDCITSPSMMFPQDQMDFQALELPNTPNYWINQTTNTSSSNNFWNDDNMFLQHLISGDNM